MKYILSPPLVSVLRVAPLAGAWIEITCWRWTGPYICVAPLAGAWIEIVASVGVDGDVQGRPPRGGVD